MFSINPLQDRSIKLQLFNKCNQMTQTNRQQQQVNMGFVILLFYFEGALFWLLVSLWLADTGFMLPGCTWQRECLHWLSYSCLQYRRKYWIYHLSSHDKHKEHEYYLSETTTTTTTKMVITETKCVFSLCSNNIITNKDRGQLFKNVLWGFVKGRIIPVNENYIVRPLNHCDSF